MTKTLLLADDSPTIQRVVALTFAGEDVTVVPVSSGDEAVEALNRSRPDVVLADIAMPGRSGYELAEYMRQSNHLASVPVLLLAGAFEPVDGDRVQAVGARGVLSKPFDPSVVVGRVRELLRDAASETAVRAAAGGYSAPPPDLPLQAPERQQPTSELDQYFEQLDRAFSELKSTRRSPSDSEPSADVEPLHGGSAPATSDAPPVAPGGAVWLTDAFSALLAAESGTGPAEPLPGAAAPPSGAPPNGAPPNGAATPAGNPAPTIDIDALVDQVTTRVLAGMSDRLVRETVTDILVATAERLVREEIDRITRDTDA